MKRGLAIVAAMIAALAMPLAADARQHGGGGHKGGGHHMSSGHHRGGGHMGNPGHRAGKHFRGGGKHYGRHFNRGGKNYGRHFNRGRHHGHHRRFWHGRWYAYGIGPCWRWSPRYGEFVWVCY